MPDASDALERALAALGPLTHPSHLLLRTILHHARRHPERSVLRARRLEEGVFIRQGQPVHELFVLLEGQVEVFSEANLQTLAVLDPPTVVGAIARMAEGATAAVRVPAGTSARALTMEQASFQR